MKKPPVESLEGFQEKPPQTKEVALAGHLTFWLNEQLTIADEQIPDLPELQKAAQLLLPQFLSFIERYQIYVAEPGSHDMTPVDEQGYYPITQVIERLQKEVTLWEGAGSLNGQQRVDQAWLAVAKCVAPDRVKPDEIVRGNYQTFLQQMVDFQNQNQIR